MFTARPAPLDEPNSGFESHLTAPQARGDRIWKVREETTPASTAGVIPPGGRRIGMRDGGAADLLPGAGDSGTVGAVSSL
jgi:hypothetical protein